MKRIATLVGTLMLVSGSAMAGNSIDDAFCIKFTNFCDGMQISAIGNDQLAGEWRNTDCAGATAGVQGSVSGGIAKVVCPTAAGCPGGIVWMFNFDLAARIFDMFGWDGFSPFPQQINQPYQIGPGLCSFSEGSGVPSSSLR